MRGKRDRRCRGRRGRRLIPARAGKTDSTPTRCCTTTAHPRACGENLQSPLLCSCPQGSSPRVRGKLRPRRRPHRRGRLIPARAGKTSYTRQAISRQRAHPRACGENADGNRGAEGGVGLIPARAGKTDHGPPQHGRRAAHPRACGENVMSIPRQVGKTGSSPRVRGKPHRRWQGPHPGGLIPARAGKTKAAKVRGRSASAHPRACGENALVGDDRAHTNGSSPRVRGKPLWADLGGGGAGLIPARAGKTAMVRNRRAEPTAHPRACGENNWVLDDGASTNGSSPRVRGKHI